MPQVPTKHIVVSVFGPDGTRIVIGGGGGDVQLDIGFSCTMTTKPERNAARLVITNLSSSNRNALSRAVNSELGLFEQAIFLAGVSAIPGAGSSQTRQADDTLENGHAYCTIDAGEDSHVGRVFEGSVEAIHSRQNGAEWLTEILVVDGEATSGVAVDQRWPARTQLYDVVKFITTKMALDAGNFTRTQLSTALGANTPSFISRAFTIKRSANSILTELFTLTNAEWWVDRGLFFVVRRGQPLVDRTLILRNEPGGLRSRPEQLDKSAIAITADFVRALRVGRKVVVDYDGRQTEYRADQVVHGLNNREGDFGTGAILRLIPNDV